MPLTEAVSLEAVQCAQLQGDWCSRPVTVGNAFPAEGLNSWFTSGFPLVPDQDLPCRLALPLCCWEQRVFPYRVRAARALQLGTRGECKDRVMPTGSGPCLRQDHAQSLLPTAPLGDECRQSRAGHHRQSHVFSAGAKPGLQLSSGSEERATAPAALVLAGPGPLNVCCGPLGCCSLRLWPSQGHLTYGVWCVQHWDHKKLWVLFTWLFQCVQHGGLCPGTAPFPLGPSLKYGPASHQADRLTPITCGIIGV